MKYAWVRDGKTISEATKKMYTKEEVEKTNAGKYKCTTTYGALAAQESDEVEVKISDPGIPCTTNAECNAADKSLTGACEEGRCVCANDYYARGDKCENGVAQAAASLLLILFAAVISRLDFV
ncbi:hypothetical protein PoB_001667100 [Plakobranchus ocellatus]|uniref:Ig-like domain-containing protein n=1 Tax=Plakobranchus ocellatus TaxID=259542 RepID=A0AAV3Z2S7_9GAST|nr:hypothetical protein PoB_001667100 [Plakobranchus ocellatus]